MSRLLSFEAWFVVSLLWTGAVAYFGYTSAPYIPLDMGGEDAETAAAFHAALTRHALTFGVIAAVPPLLFLGVIGWFRRDS